MAVPGQRGYVTVMAIDTAAIGLSIGAMVELNKLAAPDHLPFLVSSFASSAVVLYTLPGLDIARSWNVIAGQFLGALAGFLAVTVLGDAHQAVVAGVAVAAAFVLMQACRALHPPGVATALIVAIDPSSQGVRFLFVPVLAGIVMITLFAWVVHGVERRVLARIVSRVPGSDPGDAAPSVG